MPNTLGPPLTLLGLPFHEIEATRLQDIIQTARREQSPLWINLVTQENLQAISTDLELHHALIDADLLLPESWIIGSACRQIFQKPLTLYSPQALLTAVMEAETAWRLTVLVPQPCPPETFARWWENRFPTIPSPLVLEVPTDVWIGSQSTQFLEAVIRSRPELICTFLPTPLQEKWIAMHRRYLPALIVGLGANAELTPTPTPTGRTQQRLLHSKSQLLRRIEEQTVKLGVTPEAVPTTHLAAPLQQSLNSRWVEQRAPERFDAAPAAALEPALLSVFSAGSSLLFDLSGVTFIDSSALGLLITLLKSATHFDRQFVLINPSKPVMEALRLVQLDTMFAVAPDADSARIKGDLMARHGHIRFEQGGNCNEARLFWRGQLHAANWEKFWQDTLQVIEKARQKSSTPREVRFELDLGQITAIDSLGVGLLLRLLKWTREQFIFLTIVNPSPAVQQVITLAQLQGTLRQWRGDGNAPALPHATRVGYRPRLL